MNANEQAKWAAEGNTGMELLNRAIGSNTKRMAGAALVATFGPAALALIDDQQTDFVDSLLAGGIGATGLLGGGYIGYRQGVMPEDMRDEYIRSEVAQLKKASREIAKTEGVQASVDKFARGKQAAIEDISGMASKYNNQINSKFRQIPEIGQNIADLNLGNRTPREVRGMARGALIGSLAALVPGYLTMRSGPVEE